MKCSYKLCNKELTGKQTKFCSNNCAMSSHTTRRRKSRKQEAIDYKGGCCSKCGYNKSMNALQFHHLDPSKKDFAVGKGLTWNWETIKAELDKCILVCANCHFEIHDS